MPSPSIERENLGFSRYLCKLWSNCPIGHLSFFQSEMWITAEDCVLDAVNLWGKVLDVFVSVLLVVHHGLVDDIPAVAEHVVKDQHHHQGQREKQEGQQDDDNNKGDQNTFKS